MGHVLRVTATGDELLEYEVRDEFRCRHKDEVAGTDVSPSQRHTHDVRAPSAPRILESYKACGKALFAGFAYKKMEKRPQNTDMR